MLNRDENMSYGKNWSLDLFTGEKEGEVEEVTFLNDWKNVWNFEFTGEFPVRVEEVVKLPNLEENEIVFTDEEKEILETNPRGFGKKCTKIKVSFSESKFVIRKLIAYKFENDPKYYYPDFHRDNSILPPHHPAKSMFTYLSPEQAGEEYKKKYFKLYEKKIGTFYKWSNEPDMSWQEFINKD